MGGQGNWTPGGYGSEAGGPSGQPAAGGYPGAGSPAGYPVASQTEHVYGETTPATGVTEAQIVPLGDDWAGFAAPAPAPRRSHKLRWAGAIGVVLAVVLGTAAAAYVMVGSKSVGESMGATWAPKDSVFFASLRLDLPGDQHQKLADVMHVFPGFADRAQFDTALDEGLNRLTSMAGPDFSYTSAFKPWFSGELAIAVESYDVTKTGVTPDTVVIVTLKDKAKAEAWLKGQLDKSSTKWTSESYDGQTLYTSKSASTAGAYAFTDQVLLVGTTPAVKASLDTKAKGGLAKDTNFQSAMKAFAGDRLATFYFDYRFLTSQMTASGFSGMRQDDVNFLKGLMPAWVAGSVRAESDRFVVEMATDTPKTSKDLGQQNNPSKLAGLLPASTVATFEYHDLGKYVDAYISLLDSSNSTTSFRAAAKQMRDALQQIGGITWLGDATVALTFDGKVPNGGLVVETSDAATAKAKLAILNNYAALGLGTATKSSDTTYKGTTITVFTNASGGSVAGTVPDFAIAAKDDLILAGTTPFVKGVIDTSAGGSSLASKANYKAIIDAAGSKNVMSAYFDVTGLAAAVGPTFWDSIAQSFHMNVRDVKEYGQHLDAVAATSMAGNPQLARLVMTVK